MWCPLPNNQFGYSPAVGGAKHLPPGSKQPRPVLHERFYIWRAGSPFIMDIQVPYPFMTQEGAGSPIRCTTGRATGSCFVPNPSLSGYTITTRR
jgi:hypothetical protein